MDKLQAILTCIGPLLVVPWFSQCCDNILEYRWENCSCALVDMVFL